MRTSLSLLAFGLLIASAALAAHAPVTLRVMSYNIHHGEGLDGKLDLERIAQLSSQAEPTSSACRKSSADASARRSATYRRNWQNSRG